MIVRRQFIQSFMSAMAALHLPSTSLSADRSSQTLLNRESAMDLRPLTDDGDCIEAVIKVIGVGGGGCNAVEHMIDSGVKGVEFMCVNTDAQNLETARALKIIQLGNSGLSTGGNPDLGSIAASETETALRLAMGGAHMVFITAGLGGGTGTGAAPVIARIAKNMGILTVAVVTLPFEFEGPRRVNIANAGLAALEPNVDALIVMPNEKLLKSLGDDATMSEAFTQTNDAIREIVSGFAGIINVPSHVNIDFKDVRDILAMPGHVAMGTAKATGMNCARIAAEKALNFSVMADVDLSKAKGVLVMISAAKGTLKLSEAQLAMNTIRAHTSLDADFIYGTAHDKHLNEGVRVTVMATGL